MKTEKEIDLGPLMMLVYSKKKENRGRKEVIERLRERQQDEHRRKDGKSK